MKWKTVQDGDKQIVTKFLWLPLTLGGDTRWLERATFERERMGPAHMDEIFGHWRYLKWIDK